MATVGFKGLNDRSMHRYVRCLHTAKRSCAYTSSFGNFGV